MFLIQRHNIIRFYTRINLKKVFLSCTFKSPWKATFQERLKESLPQHLFLIALSRKRKNLFPVIREVTNLFLEIHEHGL